ncbi:hypothetical protein EVAR_99710_1 [Eumeta japonica]|uniref:Uncharacterized protein n=1 Tax=Eumeta variegata TaxID=151549 RepID=A0A4C1ZSC8_EUMVA|nr:hypothetical protein EVAR_99710_1 [Eumeta japonica]
MALVHTEFTAKAIWGPPTVLLALVSGATYFSEILNQHLQQLMIDRAIIANTKASLTATLRYANVTWAGRMRSDEERKCGSGLCGYPSKIKKWGSVEEAERPSWLTGFGESKWRRAGHVALRRLKGLHLEAFTRAECKGGSVIGRVHNVRDRRLNVFYDASANGLIRKK